MTPERELRELIAKWPCDCHKELGSKCQDCSKAYKGMEMPCPFCGSNKAQEIVGYVQECHKHQVEKLLAAAPAPTPAPPIPHKAICIGIQRFLDAYGKDEAVLDLDDISKFVLEEVYGKAPAEPVVPERELDLRYCAVCNQRRYFRDGKCEVCAVRTETLGSSREGK